jgi:hypothetical protein
MPLVYAYSKLAFLQEDTHKYIAVPWIQNLAKMIEACKISHENTTYIEVHE